MTRFEIQVNGNFEYVVASTVEQAIEQILASMTKTARRWAHVIPTGRDISAY